MHNNLLKVWNIHKTLLLYCLKRTEKVDNKNPNFVKRIKGRRMILSNSVAGGNKKMRFIKKEEASRLSSMLEKGDSRYAYQNEPNKTCFKHRMAYGNIKDLPRRAASDNLLQKKAFSIAKNPKYVGYQCEIA